MDNTAQGSPVPQEPGQPNPSAQQPVTAPVQQPPASAMQQHNAVRPTEPPSHPVTVAPRRESGPMAAVAPVADEQEQQVVIQEAPVIAHAHPEVMMPQEVKEAGVEPGSDADKTQLPEVKQTVTEAGDIQQPVITTVEPENDIHLDMSLEDAELAAKKTKSVKSGLAWIIREIIRQWQKKDAKEE